MPGDKPWQTRFLDGCVAINVDDRWSDFVVLQGLSIGGSAASYAGLQGRTARPSPVGESFFANTLPLSSSIR